MASTQSGLAEPHAHREAVVRVISAASCLISFQSYLVAPLIPALAAEFHSSTSFLGWLVPAFMLPYGAAALFYGPLSDRFGRKPVILGLLAMMMVTVAGASTAGSAEQLLAWRVLGGIATAGIIPISLALVGDLFPYEQRGRPLGWMFAANAGGMAFGSTLGAYLNPYIGWRNEFRITAVLAAVTLACGLALRNHFEGKIVRQPIALWSLLTGYVSLYGDRRAAQSYIYILLNGIFHSGVFSWLGVYFSQSYQLGDEGIGMALLGYGIPGMIFGPTIGRLADRIGRKRIIPVGILLAALSVAALILRPPVNWLPACTALMSLGYHMTHPMLVGIITSVNPARRGLSMGMNAFVLFVGFGLGALLFRLPLRYGFAFALSVFTAGHFCLGLLSFRLFRKEDASAGDRSAKIGNGTA